MQRIVIGRETEGQRLNKLLGKYLDDAPQSFIYKMLRKKNIKLNQKKAQGKEILKTGDTVEIFLTDDTIAKFRKDGQIPDIQEKQDLKAPFVEYRNPLQNIQILYEDADVLILNKPVGMLSQKAKPEDYSLNECIVDYYHTKNRQESLFIPSVCNRLDRNTSGIILAGMSLKGTQELSRLLKNRTLHKYYLTIVYGKIEKSETIRGFLAKKKNHNQVTVYESLSAAEKNSGERPAYIETRYEPVATGQFQDMWFSLLLVKLVTGKTHQIRAHLDSIGHSIIGDGKYGLKSVNALVKREFGLKNQLLHACLLKFPEQDCGLEALAGKEIRAELPDVFYEAGVRLFGEDIWETGYSDMG